MNARRDNTPEAGTRYAHRLTRLLFKSCAAQQIGLEAVALIIHVVHTQDAAWRHSAPVMFWNSQLSETLGFRSPKQLNEARKRAVDAGWLTYTREHDRAVGYYSTSIPKHLYALSDAPIEPVSDSPATSEPTSIPPTEQESEQESEQQSYGNRNSKVTGTGKPSNPIPSPKPKPKRKRAPDDELTEQELLTLDDAKQFGQEIELDVCEVEKFWDHHKANGWIMRNGRPCRDRRAAMRNWKRRVSDFTPTSQSGNALSTFLRSGSPVMGETKGEQNARLVFKDRGAHAS